MNNNSASIINETIHGIFLGDTPKQLILKQHIDKLALDGMKAAGMGFCKRNISWLYIKYLIKKALKANQNVYDIEQILQKTTAKVIDRDKIYLPSLRERAIKIFENLTPYLVGDNILDLGAGNGLLGEAISINTGKNVFLVDVVNYNLSSLPMNIFAQGNTVPFEDKSVDTTIIYLVLHHSDNPVKTLQEAIRVTKKRIIIMEGYIDDEFMKESNIFFDWFCNRVLLHSDINVPLNFHTTNDWEKIFQQNKLSVQFKNILGIDEPKAPEYHVLYVLDLEKQ